MQSAPLHSSRPSRHLFRPYCARHERSCACGRHVHRAARPAGSDGAHWYYRVDRTNNRKCWYLAAVRIKEPEIPAPERAPDTAAPPILSTLFASLFGGLTGAPAAGRGRRRRMSRASSRPAHQALRIDDIVQRDRRASLRSSRTSKATTAQTGETGRSVPKISAVGRKSAERCRPVSRSP